MIELHQGSTLSLFLFAVVMNGLTRHIQRQMPWCMLFAHDIVLIDETRGRANARLEFWTQTLKSKRFRLRKIKTQHLKCKFNDVTHEVNAKVRLDPQPIP